MGVKMKVSKKISPKDKSKIKKTIEKSTVIKTDGNKVKSITRNKNVRNNKKDK